MRGAPMPTPEYYCRQAESSFNLAQMTRNPETKRHLLELVNNYRMKAENARAHQLDAFIAKSNVGVTCLSRR